MVSDSSDIPYTYADTIDAIIDQELSAALEAGTQLTTQNGDTEDNDSGSIKSIRCNGHHFFNPRLLELDPTMVPEFSPDTYQGYHHVTWYVGNAKQAAYYFVTAFGFKIFAFRGLENGSREVTSYVLKNGDTVFEFCSALRNTAASVVDEEDILNSKAINEFIDRHGEGVKDVAFHVASLDEVFTVARCSGATVLEPPAYYRVQNDDGGLAYIGLARVQIFGDTVHTLVEKSRNYNGFLPDYTMVADHPQIDFLQNANYLDSLPPIELIRIDHCVQNQGWNKMVESCEAYARTFGFHQFWSVDENDVSTEFSALHSIVMASPDDMIKMPINEPARGRCKSQIEEFIDFYDGPGVQHIALLTDNIIETVKAMRHRGVEFIEVPKLYYDTLKQKLQDADFTLQEEFEAVKELGILVDFDENGYLLQLFTKPLVVRPTVFIEVIQRRNHNGFGAGNFKALFETLETLQRQRGNLTESDDHHE